MNTYTYKRSSVSDPMYKNLVDAYKSGSESGESDCEREFESALRTLKSAVERLGKAGEASSLGPPIGLLRALSDTAWEAAFWAGATAKEEK